MEGLSLLTELITMLSHPDWFYLLPCPCYLVLLAASTCTQARVGGWDPGLVGG